MNTGTKRQPYLYLHYIKRINLIKHNIYLGFFRQPLKKRGYYSKDRTREKKVFFFCLDIGYDLCVAWCFQRLPKNRLIKKLLKCWLHVALTKAIQKAKPVFSPALPFSINEEFFERKSAQKQVAIPVSTVNCS